MADIYSFSETEIIAFFLVLLRLSAFIVAWPIFGEQSVPAQVKILFSLVLAFVVFPLVDMTQIQAGFESISLVWLGIREVFIGLSIGYLARMFFFAVSMAGEVITLSMGLSSSQLFNPAMGRQMSSVEHFHVLLAMLFFLAINGHHIFLSGIVDSFGVVPLSGDLLSLTGLNQVGKFAQEITEIAVKLSAPVLMAILLMNIAMGVIGRAVPQINVLITSLPVNILAGFLVLIVSIPLLVWQMHDLLDLTAHRVFEVLKSY